MRHRAQTLTSESMPTAVVLRCSKALLNAKVGLEGVIATDGALDVVIASVQFISDKMKCIVLEVFAALCLDVGFSRDRFSGLAAWPFLRC